MNDDPRRISNIRRRWPLAVVVCITTAAFLLLLWPFRSPLLVAACLAAVLQGVTDHVGRWLLGRRRIAASIVSLAVLVAILSPLGAVASFAANEAQSALDYLHQQLGVDSFGQLRTNNFPAPLEDAIKHVLDVLHATREQLDSLIGEAARRAKDLAPGFVAQTGRLALDTLLMVVALYFLLVEGHRLVAWLRRVSPLKTEETASLIAEFQHVAKGAVVGNFLSGALQGVAAGVGFVIFNIPHAAFFGFLTALASLVPVIGTAVVWVPAAGLLAITGSVGAALGLVAWCLVTVVGVEHVAKPFILSKTMGHEFHPGLMLLALVGGIEVFGLIGMLLGPLIAAFFVAVMLMIERRNSLEPDPAAEPKRRRPPSPGRPSGRRE